MTKSINKYLDLIVGEKCQQWRKISYCFVFVFCLLASCKFKKLSLQNHIDRPKLSVYNKFVIEDYDSIFKKKYHGAWKNNDTFYFKTIIDSLYTFSYKDCILACNFLSEETGFGYTLVNIDDFTWFDTLSQENKKRVITMMVEGFKVYKKSNLFMQKLPYTILLHEHLEYDFIWDGKRRLLFFKELEVYSNKVAKCNKNWTKNTKPEYNNWKPIDC